MSRFSFRWSLTSLDHFERLRGFWDYRVCERDCRMVMRREKERRRKKVVGARGAERREVNHYVIQSDHRNERRWSRVTRAILLT